MLLGIITHDDAMDILRQEQTEDILAFGGVSRDAEANEETLLDRAGSSRRSAVGSAGCSCCSSPARSPATSRTSSRGSSSPCPTSIDFIPLLIGTGGNAGSQTVGTIIRGLALGEIQRNDGLRVLYREWLTGLLMGVAARRDRLRLHLRPASQRRLRGRDRAGDPVICMWANSVGALVPILARRFGIDPAVVSAPLISTLVDATGLVIFYTVAIVLLIKLAGTGSVAP